MGERNIKEITRKVNPFSPPAKLKVCAYVRVSTYHTGQLNSLQNQTQYYERLISSNPDYQYCGIFSDAGISGAKENRPGFLAMMEKARSGELDLIITKSISRFARNTLMLLKYVRELRDIGVGVIFEEEMVNSLKFEGELLLTVLAAIAEEERKSVCSNVQWGMQNKCKRGEVMVDTNRLLGFDKDAKGNLVINVEQAKIVRQIYQLYLSGISGCRIAQILNEENVPTYTSKPWKSHRILRIISNEKYAGDCLMQKSFVAENGRQIINRGQKDKYFMENNHPPIISRPDWEAAQVIRESRRKKSYPLSSMLRCPYCGASLTRVTLERQWVKWVCATYLHKGKKECLGIRITDEILEELIGDTPITEPMVVEGGIYGKARKERSKKDYRLIPAAQYKGFMHGSE
ncbi:recombinase family protein [Pelotomaculum propionicicum]|uniref:recombinase family protein n=1 Tax=Pelotomaculum propionicicum TaxID=258475 RepID=UPI003B762F3F